MVKHHFSSVSLNFLLVNITLIKLSTCIVCRENPQGLGQVGQGTCFLFPNLLHDSYQQPPPPSAEPAWLQYLVTNLLYAVYSFVCKENNVSYSGVAPRRKSLLFYPLTAQTALSTHDHLHGTAYLNSKSWSKYSIQSVIFPS